MESLLINLLPWREELRHFKKRQFLQLLSVSLVSVILLTFIFHYYWQHCIADLQQQNKIFKQKEMQSAAEIKNLQNLKNQTQQLLTQLNFIHDEHVVSVRRADLFAALMRIIPRNISLTEYQCMGKDLTLSGLVDSHVGFAKFIQRLSSVKRISHPLLQEMKIASEAEMYRYSFMIKAKLL